MPRNQLIIAKLGTGVLTGGGDQLDEGLIASIAKQVAEIVAAQSQVIVVTSAAVALGRSIIGLEGKGRGVATLQAGAGIVADSDPRSEHEECHRKMAALLAAVELAQRGLR